MLLVDIQFWSHCKINFCQECRVGNQMQISQKADIFPSMDSLYPPDLNENGAVDVLYAASWICSENG